MNEGLHYQPTPEKKRVAPVQGELLRLDGSRPFEITRETLAKGGETFYLGSEARITIQYDKKSPSGLTIYSPFASEKYTDIKSGLNWVGKSQSCDVIIDSEEVSDFHLSIRFEPDVIYVDDNESEHGTRVEL